MVKSTLTRRPPVNGRLVLRAQEARERFNLRPKPETLKKIKERRIASELVLERHERDVLL